MVPKTFTATERLILINQYEILGKLAEMEEDEYMKADFEYKAGIISSGYTGLYNGLFEHISEEQPSLVEETIDILNMYRRVNRSIDALDANTRNGLTLDAIQFDGFDGNDKHYYVAEIMHGQGLWQELGDQVPNSHTGMSIMRYRRMLPKYSGFEQNGEVLTIEQLQQLIDAR